MRRVLMAATAMTGLLLTTPCSARNKWCSGLTATECATILVSIVDLGLTARNVLIVIEGRAPRDYYYLPLSFSAAQGAFAAGAYNDEPDALTIIGGFAVGLAGASIASIAAGPAPTIHSWERALPFGPFDASLALFDAFARRSRLEGAIEIVLSSPQVAWFSAAAATEHDARGFWFGADVVAVALLIHGIYAVVAPLPPPDERAQSWWRIQPMVFTDRGPTPGLGLSARF